MEEMMIATTAFIRGEAAAAGKKKGNASRRAHDQSKRHASEWRSNFRDQPKVGKKEVPAKDKSMAIYMIQPSHRMTRQKVTQSFERVYKITFPSLTTNSGTEGPLVIEAEIGGHTIHRMYVDGGSSTEVLYEHCFNQLRPEIKNQMVPATTSLTGFSGETIWPLGQLRLLVTIGDADHFTKAWMNFMIVRSLSPYNSIIGRHGIREIQAIPSTAHKMLKFPVDGGIVTIRSTILIPAECATVITSSKEIPKEAEPSDMIGVPRLIAEHRLDIQEGYSPVRHKKRGQAPELAKAIQTEAITGYRWRSQTKRKRLSTPANGYIAIPKCISALKKAGATYQRLVDKAFDSQVGRNIEVYIDDLVIKSHTEAEMLRDIDETFRTLRKIKAITGYRWRSQTKRKRLSTPANGYIAILKCLSALKNAGATYQRLVDKAFDSQVGRNIEVYIDDLVIKSHTEAEMLRDIDETFRTLRKINMKLNPKKCTFGVVEGMFLGYMISPEGIKPCPDKTEAVLQLPSPRTIKEVQSLNGKLASLNRFLSKSAERFLSLCKTLKKCIKKSNFYWTPKADQAFKQLKQHLSELPLLVAPKPKEELIVYLSATHGAISAVLMTERGTVQTPVYFVSCALHGPELNYTQWKS
ncbi:reverse transcriptase domain-containing protein [Tanacetum coccineum]